MKVADYGAAPLPPDDSAASWDLEAPCRSEREQKKRQVHRVVVQGILAKSVHTGCRKSTALVTYVLQTPGRTFSPSMAAPRSSGNARTASELREWVTSFYEAHNPEKLGSIDVILGKYEGKEEELVSQLERKYLGNVGKPEEQDDLQRKLLVERRAKEEAVRRLGECSKQFAALQERVVVAERRAAELAAESAASSFATAAKHRLLLRTLEEKRDLQAHLGIALDRLGAAADPARRDDEVAAAFDPSSSEIETLYRSARAELAACGRDRHLARERVVEVTKRSRALEDEAARLKKALESASHSERAIEAAQAQTRAAVESERSCRADLEAELKKNVEMASSARRLREEIDDCRRAKAMLEDHYHERRRDFEARAIDLVKTEENRYRMLRADLLSREVVVADLAGAARDQRLATAQGDRDRYARIAAELTRERDALKEDVEKLKGELRVAAQRIVQAENLLSSTPSRQHQKNHEPESVVALESHATTASSSLEAASLPRDICG